jgi:hypothetical protein
MLPYRSRARKRGALVWLVCLSVLSILVSAGPVLADKNEAKVKRTKKKKGLPAAAASVTPTAAGSPAEQNLTNIPLPVGHEAKGLVLPDFDLEGHLRGKFVAGSARRIDEERVSFQDLKITTFTPESQPDLEIDLHTSIFNLKTKILTSSERSTVSRADFNIVGDTIEFDTNARTGRMTGNVKMVIKGQSHLMEKAPE